MALNLSCQQIMDLIPNRSGMFALDEVRELIPGKSATARFWLDPNHKYIGGDHFAGVHTVQLAVEVGAVIALSKPEYKGKVEVLLGINHARFYKMLYPGDFLELSSTLLSEREDKCIVTISTVVYREGEIAAEVELALALR